MPVRPKRDRTKRSSTKPASTNADGTGGKEFSPELAAKFCDIVRRGNFRETACAQVGVRPRQMRKWLTRAAAGDKLFTQFVLDLDAAEAAAEDIMVVAIRKAAIADWRAAAWLLERRAAARWGFKAQVEFTVQEELARILDVVEQQLGSEASARVFGALTDGAVSAGAPRGSGPAESGPGPADPIN
jgi:hypothetical protein